MKKNAKTWQITHKKKPHFLSIPSLEDFDYQEYEIINVDDIVNQPNISLYCLDFPQKLAIFVETSPDINITQLPFFYQAQYEAAQRLIMISFAELSEIAQNIESPQKRIMIYSVGRCGSTLLHSVFNKLKNTVSFSEPGVYDQLVIMRQWDRSNEAEISELVKTCTQLLGKSLNSSMQVIKFRSYGIEIADLLLKHFPDSQILFVYRDVETWMESAFRASLGNIPNDTKSLIEMQIEASQISPLIATHQLNPPLSYVKILTLAWLSVRECYLSLEKQFPYSLVVDFQDLKATPKPTLLEIFKYCDLPTTHLDSVFEILKQDSQENTVLAQANLNHQSVKLNSQYLEEIRETLDLHSKFSYLSDVRNVSSKYHCRVASDE